MFDFREKIFRHPWSTPTLAVLCLTVVLGAMATVSVVVLVMERDAAVEDKVRLALWRMDSALTPIIAEENARPYFAYLPFFAPEHAYNSMFQRIDGEVLIPSALFTYRSDLIFLHFQIEPDGRLTSPKVPIGVMRTLAESGYTPHEQIEQDVQRLRQLAAILSPNNIATLIEPRPNPSGPAAPDAPPQPGDRADQPAHANASGQENQSEYVLRLQNNVSNIASQKPGASPGKGPGEANTPEGVFRSVWLGHDLFLVRRVTVDGLTYHQGCWLQWPAIRQWLLAKIEDQLPHADLRPATGSYQDLTRRLAALPITVVPGPVPEIAGPMLSGLRVSLLFLWTGLILAALASAILLRSALLLSERRAAFVSAVTHELRTPLTTFRLYSQMLSQGMVRDPQQQMLYLQTLESEADRLAHLVENVLSYARLERVGPVGEKDPIPLDDLLAHVRNRIEERARQSGMTIQVDVPANLLGIKLQAEPTGVEQTLFNLVDNACKYAATATDRRIHLEAFRRRRRLVLRVRDHGPGVGADVRLRLFRPFSKSAQAAAGSTPGVGLGLALALRYARHMGGDLALERGPDQGACFAMSLNVVR